MSAAAIFMAAALAAAGAEASAPASAPATAREAAKVELPGVWVSVVTEDWRFRMVTPPKGDYTSVPLNAEGRRVADSWDLAADAAAGLQCKAYGAPGLLRLPGRLRISWVSDQSLRLEADAGTQTRLLDFGAAPAAPAEPSWQGRSAAAWEDTRIPASSLGIVRVPPAPPSYALKVVTRGLRPGYLRKNGVPYSGQTVLTEYFDVITHRGVDWLVVTSVVDDPAYLVQPFITTTHFKRERDASKWWPTPCQVAPPTRGPLPRFPQ